MLTGKDITDSKGCVPSKCVRTVRYGKQRSRLTVRIRTAGEAGNIDAMEVQEIYPLEVGRNRADNLDGGGGGTISRGRKRWRNGVDRNGNIGTRIR